MHSTCDGRPVIRLRLRKWKEHMISKGLTSSRARANHIDVSPTTVSRIERGSIQPGREFIAASLASTGVKFEDFFEIERVAS